MKIAELLSGSDRLIDRYVLAKGKPYRVRAGRRSLKPGTEFECFANTMRAIAANPKMALDYVEGYVVVNGQLVHHAWVGVDNEAVELTLRDTSGCEYYGVPFEPATVTYCSPVLWDTRRLLQELAAQDGR